VGKKKNKILFIEDEPDQVMMVTLRLQKSGFSVVTAEGGVEGLEQVLKQKPDLILLDIIMPGMDGFEVCQKLKSDPRTAKIPVIVTTAAGMDDVEHRCLAVGAEECVRKPYDAADLLRKIAELLGI